MIKLQPLPYRWVGKRPEIHDRLREEFQSWEGTPYIPDQQAKGVGVDCVRFVCAIMDALRGTTQKIETLPADVALHNRAGAFSVMRKIMRLYEPFMALGPHNPFVYPGDVLITGKAGPGHAMIVGPDPNTIWHATSPRVQRTGFTLPSNERVFRVYRLMGLH